MIDQPLVVRKLAMIGEDLKQLDQFVKMSQAEYLKEQIYQRAAERYLERIIGRMIDVNFHIITDLGHAPPKDYFNSFLGLADEQILPREFAKVIAHAAGLRNRIVHEYDEIDQTKVYEAIKSAVIDIRTYLAHISDYLDRSET